MHKRPGSISGSGSGTIRGEDGGLIRLGGIGEPGGVKSETGAGARGGVAAALGWESDGTTTSP